MTNPEQRRRVADEARDEEKAMRDEAMSSKVTLTDGERETLRQTAIFMPALLDDHPLYEAVESLIAARIAEALREAAGDAWVLSSELHAAYKTGDGPHRANPHTEGGSDYLDEFAGQLGAKADEYDRSDT